MGLFDKRKNSLMDDIRCDEQNYLIWKWHPKGTIKGENNRENAVRWGSSLRVKDGEVAVFVYNTKDGYTQEYIEGPFDGIINTENLPIIADIIGLAYGGGTPFPAEVYFINLAYIIQSKFAVPYFDVYDPRFPDFGVPLAVRGTISFYIDNYVEFIKLHRLIDFSLEDFKKQIKDVVSRYVKDVVTNAPATHNIPVIQLESKIAQINDIVEYDLRERLQEDFGIVAKGIDIGVIEIDKTAPEYAQLMAITKELTFETAKAQTQANIKNIEDKQRIDSENYEETLRIQREESQYAQRKATQTSNFAAYQVEKQAEVGVAGANALGQMGSNGAGNIDLGTGVNMAGVMASMAIGGVVGQNIAGVMNNAINGVNQPIQTGIIPPPVPTSAYYVAVNGQATGSYDIKTLSQMAKAGQLTANSLVWKNGMAEWVKAGSVDELKDLFIENMPPIPK